MTQLTDQTERQTYNAIMAARAGSPDGLTSQLERQIYAALVAAGTGGGGGGGGTPGKAATVTVGTTTTLAPGSQATVSNTGTASDAVLNFGIPQGEQGPQGQQGIQGPTGPTGPAGSDGENAVAALTPRGDYSAAASPTYVVNDYISYNGNSYACKADNPTNVAPTSGGNDDPFWQLMALQGAKGATGTAATISIGTVTTLAPGSQATVSNTGTANAAIFNYGIPAGEKGERGPIGDNFFSNDEEEWGTWVDGSTIYRKSYYNVAHSTNGSFTNGTISLVSLNIDTIVKIESVRRVVSGGYAGTVNEGQTYLYLQITPQMQLTSNIQTQAQSVVAGVYTVISIYYTKKQN